MIKKIADEEFIYLFIITVKGADKSAFQQKSRHNIKKNH